MTASKWKFLPRTIAVAAVFAVGLLVGRASADDPTTPTFPWWSALSDANKGVAVVALLDGYVEGWYQGSDDEGNRIIAAAQEAADANHLPAAMATWVHDEAYRKDAQGHYVSLEIVPTFGRTDAQYQTLIDAFYSHYPNGHDVSIGEILTCIADKPRLSCDQVDQSHQE